MSDYIKCYSEALVVREALEAYIEERTQPHIIAKAKDDVFNARQVLERVEADWKS